MYGYFIFRQRVLNRIRSLILGPGSGTFHKAIDNRVRYTTYINIKKPMQLFEIIQTNQAFKTRFRIRIRMDPH
jgi:hypothetical protein